jgi:K+-sensing histidine kinase KdpD
MKPRARPEARGPDGAGLPAARVDTEGLGLSIVTAITKAHHGGLTVNLGPRGGLGITFPARRQEPQRNRQ